VQFVSIPAQFVGDCVCGGDDGSVSFLVMFKNETCRLDRFIFFDALPVILFYCDDLLLVLVGCF
jgi:hypothetical protein